jgi:hypothetical protein
MKIVSLVRLDNGQPFVDRVEQIANADGSISFRLFDGPNAGKFVGQTPSDGQPWASVYGVRYPDMSDAGSYQRATPDNGKATFVTRTEDIPCSYLICTGQVY